MHSSVWHDADRMPGFSPAYLEKVRDEARRRRQIEMEIAAEELRAQQAKVDRDAAVEMFKSRFMPKWAFDIVEEVAAERGVSLRELAGNIRSPQVAHARHDVIYRIKAAKPALSSSQIGLWFDRDHTAVLYGLAAHAQRAGLPRLSGFNLEKRLPA